MAGGASGNRLIGMIIPFNLTLPHPDRLALHVSQAAKFLHHVSRFLVLSTACAFSRCRGFEFLDNLREGVGGRFDRCATGLAADGPKPLALPGVVKAHNRDLLALDVLPDIQLGPVQQRVHPDVVILRLPRFVLVP
jgi:hypothetical protein